MASFCAVGGALAFLVGAAMAAFGLMSSPIAAPFLGAGVVGLLLGAGLLANAVQLDRGD